MPGRSHGSSYTHPPRTQETVVDVVDDGEEDDPPSPHAGDRDASFSLAFAGRGLQSVEGLALRGGVHDKWRGYNPSTLRHPLH